MPQGQGTVAESATRPDPAQIGGAAFTFSSEIFAFSPQSLTFRNFGLSFRLC